MGSHPSAPLTPFIGRDRELGQVRALLDGCRLLTVTGPGGCGKTRFALFLAAIAAHQDGRDVRFVDLSGVETASAVLTAVATAIQVHESAASALQDALLVSVRDRDLLPVVDDCEHVLQTVAPLLVSVLEHGAGVTVLATSRQPPDVAGEVTWRLPGMDVPDDDRLDERAAIRFDAVRLFVELAGRVRPGFSLTADSVQPVVRICRQLDGLPLAIELAAAHLRTMSLDRLAASMDDALSLLQGRSARAARHQALAACIEHSHRRLTPDEQATFRRLGVFSGSFTIEAAGSICAFSSTRARASATGCWRPSVSSPGNDCVARGNWPTRSTAIWTTTRRSRAVWRRCC